MSIVELYLGQTTFLEAETRFSFRTTAIAHVATNLDGAATIENADELLRNCDTWYGRRTNVKLVFHFVFCPSFAWHLDHEERQRIGRRLEDAKTWHQLGLEFKLYDTQLCQTASSNILTFEAELTEATTRSMRMNGVSDTTDLTNVRAPDTVLNCQLLSVSVRWDFFMSELNGTAPNECISTTPSGQSFCYEIVSDAAYKGLMNVIGPARAHRQMETCSQLSPSVKLIDLAPSLFKPTFAEQIARRKTLIGSISKFLDKFSMMRQTAGMEQQAMNSRLKLPISEHFAEESTSHHLWMTMTNALKDRKPARRLRQAAKSLDCRASEMMTNDIGQQCLIKESVPTNETEIIDTEQDSQSASQMIELGKGSTDDQEIPILFEQDLFLEDRDHNVVTSVYADEVEIRQQWPLKIVDDMLHFQHHLDTDGTEMLLGKGLKLTTDKLPITSFETVDCHVPDQILTGNYTKDVTAFPPPITATDMVMQERSLPENHWPAKVHARQNEQYSANLVASDHAATRPPSDWHSLETMAQDTEMQEEAFEGPASSPKTAASDILGLEDCFPEHDALLYQLGFGVEDRHMINRDTLLFE